MAKKRKSKKQSSSSVKTSFESRKGKVRKSYDSQRMQSAVYDVVAGMSVKKAAQKWSVPRTTLNDIKLGRYKHDARPGPSTILTQAEESLLQEWVVVGDFH